MKILEVHINCSKCTVVLIAGNFQGRKLSQIGEKYDFRGENFPAIWYLFN